MGSGSSKNINLTNPQRVKIPETFDIFYKKSLSIKLYLGVEKGNALYAATLPRGWWGDVVLHAGPDDKTDGELARVKDSGRLGGDCTMIMPPLGNGNQPVMEEMRIHGSLIKDYYAFPCQVGTGGRVHPEKFEWHRATKEDVHAMGKSRKVYRESWKLVRPANNNEIVAFCANDYVVSYNSTGTFKFINSGATGELGDLWALMATLSFLRLWQRYIRLIMTGSIASSSAVGAAGAAAA